ncbi:DNA polymerase alpha-associated DNA helicase A [Schizosaccharomyces pombe]
MSSSNEQICLDEDWIQKFGDREIEFVDEAQKSEVDETEKSIKRFPLSVLQRKGLALINLRIGVVKTGFGGKTIIDFEKDPAFSNGEELPANSFSPGDVVSIRQDFQSSKKKRLNETDILVEGVVTRVHERHISVALKSEEDIPSSVTRLSVVKLVNHVTYERMRHTMLEFKRSIPEYRNSLFYTLIGRKKADVSIDQKLIGDIKYFNKELNASQKEAVKFSIAVKELSLIHGPPGTGKTHTLVEIIQQLVLRNKRILVCGASNLAVDNIVDRLSSSGIPMVRLGHPARLLPSILDHSLDVLSRTGDNGDVIRGISEDIDVCLSKITKTKNGRERREIYKNIRELRKDYRKYEAKTVANIVSASKVVFCTLHGAGSRQLKGQRFDAVIIDEASQALEPQCWIPLLGMNKVILAGDHMQLLPNVQSKRPYISMFERLVKSQGDLVKCFLNIQYRMHELISKFPSDTFYDSKLVPAEEVKKRLLMDLENVEETELTDSPIYFYDTLGNYQEDDRSEDMQNFYQDSKSNHWEAQIVSYHISGLLEAGLEAKDIAVVTPYNAQVALIRQLLKEKGIEVEMGSVDKVQGREKEAIVFSLVRSNDVREVGFLAEKRRLNVAITRPKRHLCVIGDSNTVKWASEFFHQWVDFLEENAIVMDIDATMFE